MLYRVMNTLVDTDNGLHLKVGQFVETNERVWVARMGDSLREEQIAPSNAEVVKVANTVESIVAVVETETEDDSADVEAKSLSKVKIPNKAILGDKTENK